MSVDDAFRKLMEQDALGPLGGSAGAGLAEDPAAQATLVKTPAAPAAPASKPAAPPLDLSRVKKVQRYAHHPVDSRSQIAEEYRILRTRLQSLDLERPSILLTSCHHNEGKTSTALNLALCLGRRREAKILLVDFDLRRPRLHKFLGVPKTNMDIAAVLRGKCDVEEGIVYSEEDNLYSLLASREYSGGTELLETPRTREIIDRLHATFDFVVMDSCPCLSTSDPAILGPQAGAVLMVVRSLRTQRESILHAVNSMKEVGVDVSGIILTFVRYFIPRYLYRYQYYHGYYYYRGYAYGGGQDVNTDEAVPVEEAGTGDASALLPEEPPEE